MMMMMMMMMMMIFLFMLSNIIKVRGISWTILPDLASAPLNGQITNGTRSSVKMPPGSVLLCPGPVPGLLGWAYPEQLGLNSTAC